MIYSAPLRSILFLLPSRALSGGILVVRRYAQLLARKGYEVTVAYLNPADLDGDSVLPCIQPACEVFLSDFTGAETFDAAVATWWETAYHVAQIKARSYFYFVQGFEERLYPSDSVWPLLVQRTYQSGFHFLTVNSGLQRYLQKSFGNSSTIIPPGISLESYDCEPLIERTTAKLRVLVEGSPVVEYKRVGLAFKALSQLQNIEVVYVSPAGKAKADWKIDHFFERVPHEKMPAIYRSCDLTLKLSTDESFSMPVLESFAAGATAVAAEFHGGSDFIRDGENAIVVPVDNVESAAAALRKLQSDSELLHALGREARKTAAQYSWSELSGAMESALLAGFAKGVPETPPLAGCLAAYQGAHAMRLELTQALSERELYRDEHEKVSRLFGESQNYLLEARRDAAQLRASRSYRIGHTLARAYRRINKRRNES